MQEIASLMHELYSRKLCRVFCVGSYIVLKNLPSLQTKILHETLAMVIFLRRVHSHNYVPIIIIDKILGAVIGEDG